VCVCVCVCSSIHRVPSSLWYWQPDTPGSAKPLEKALSNARTDLGTAGMDLFFNSSEI